MKKDILIIGGGGREHAIAASLQKSPHAGTIYAQPGNGGMQGAGVVCTGIDASDLSKTVEFLRAHPNIYMTVVAPDNPLALGFVDALTAQGFRAFGPTKNAAKIETSKAFAKEFMAKYNIPTAAAHVFNDAQSALEYVSACPIPVVVKADGLALGKGAFVALTREDAVSAVKKIMQERAFGDSGNKIVIEEFLAGYEVTVMCFTDSVTVLPMVTAKDFKRALDGDKGENTGGMGAFSPHNQFDDTLLRKAYNTVIIPTVNGLISEGTPFKGVIYFQLMVCSGGDIRVIEYNARFADPETQAVLPRLKTDLLTVFDAVIDGNLSKIKLEWDARAAVCVVLASEGYPGDYKKGREITIGKLPAGITVFHAGTKYDDGRLKTSGGRVLSVVALGSDIAKARSSVYMATECIHFEGMQFRTDIAK